MTEIVEFESRGGRRSSQNHPVGRFGPATPLFGLSLKSADDPAFSEIGWQAPGTPVGLFTEADIIGS